MVELECSKFILGIPPNTLTIEDFRHLAKGYSCSDIGTVVRDALMEPVRKIQMATHYKYV